MRPEWTADYEAWQAKARDVKARAKAIADSRREEAFRLAATVGLPRNLCCIHNASIDEAGTGWCAGPGGWERHKVAKRVEWMLDEWQWEATRIADRIVSRSFSALQARHRGT